MTIREIVEEFNLYARKDKKGKFCIAGRVAPEEMPKEKFEYIQENELKLLDYLTEENCEYSINMGLLDDFIELVHRELRANILVYKAEKILHGDCEISDNITMDYSNEELREIYKQYPLQSSMSLLDCTTVIENDIFNKEFVEFARKTLNAIMKEPKLASLLLTIMEKEMRVEISKMLK